MKIILIGLLALTSITAFSANDCTIKIKKSNLMGKRLTIEARRALSKKYKITRSNKAEFLYHHDLQCNMEHTSCNFGVTISENYGSNAIFEYVYADENPTKKQTDFMNSTIGFFMTGSLGKKSQLEAIKKLRGCI